LPGPTEVIEGLAAVDVYDDGPLHEYVYGDVPAAAEDVRLIVPLRSIGVLELGDTVGNG
jgi:hypothetical protein